MHNGIGRYMYHIVYVEVQEEKSLFDVEGIFFHQQVFNWKSLASRFLIVDGGQ